MKLSKTPTNTVIVKAFTNSQWDDVDFALLNLDKEDLLRKWDSAVYIAGLHTWFKSLEFWGYADLYINCYESEDEVTNLINDFKLGAESWSFIEITEDEIAKFNKPEQVVSAGSFSVSSDGCVKWVGYGKHTEEEFSTGLIKIDEL